MRIKIAFFRLTIIVFTFFIKCNIVFAIDGHWDSLYGDIFAKSEININDTEPDYSTFYTSGSGPSGDSGFLIYGDASPKISLGSLTNSPSFNIDFNSNPNIYANFLNSYSQKYVLDSVPEDKKHYFNDARLCADGPPARNLNNTTQFPDNMIHVYIGNPNNFTIGGGSTCDESQKVTRNMVVVNSRGTNDSNVTTNIGQLDYIGTPLAPAGLLVVIGRNNNGSNTHINIYNGVTNVQGFFLDSEIGISQAGFNGYGGFLAIHESPSGKYRYLGSTLSDIRFEYKPSLYFKIPRILKIQRITRREVAP
jgi:hypothetical protein